MKIGRWVLLVHISAAVGCTSVVVKKDPGPPDRGVRFNRPKPYLYIGPAAPREKSSSGQQPGNRTPRRGGRATEATGSPTDNGSPSRPGRAGRGAQQPGLADNNFIKVVMEIKYLPDYNEEYSIKLRPGLGTGSLNFKLDDGWNLTSVGMQTDQKIPEIISSVANLVGAIRGAPTGGASSGASKARTGAETLTENLSIIVDTRPDVPLGFYEPVIATDPHGRKSLFGWRYVGFMPFLGCPVDVCAAPKTVLCDQTDLWGIVATPNSIKFQRLGEIEAGLGQPTMGNPYRYMDQNGQIVPGIMAPPSPATGPTPALPHQVPQPTRDPDGPDTPTRSSPPNPGRAPSPPSPSQPAAITPPPRTGSVSPPPGALAHTPR